MNIVKLQIMNKLYHIFEIGMLGKYQDFDEAILVKVIPADWIDEFYNLGPDNDNDEEEYHRLQEWLVFKNYPGKMRWLSQKQDLCEAGEYWSLDLEDFVSRLTSITNKETGQGFLRPLHQVIMVEDEMDIVESKEFGVKYNGRTGSQKRLDELGLELVGCGDKKYYLISGMEELEDEPFNPKCDARFWTIFGENKAKRWSVYAIPYNCPDAPGGMYQIDKIVLCMNGEGEHDFVVVRVEIENYGIYNYLTKEAYKFG